MCRTYNMIGSLTTVKSHLEKNQDANGNLWQMNEQEFTVWFEEKRYLVYQIAE